MSKPRMSPMGRPDEWERMKADYMKKAESPFNDLKKTKDEYDKMRARAEESLKKVKERR